ncbi:MAG: Smr/MutS family protein [Bacilli bacterium]|nr:Smr/MutS family protein [Bacilli bacterium]
MQNIYQTFEFNKIKSSILEYSKTELGQEYIDSLEMMTSSKEVSSALEDLKEMMSIIVRFGVMPIATSANALKLIEMAKKTALLTPRDLNLIADDVLTSQKISSFLKKIDLSYPRTSQRASGFYDLSNLEKEIHRVITNALTVADNATPELKEIRAKLKKAEATLNSRIASLAFSYSIYLSGDNATIRDGHFVLPVKTVDKNKVPGIIYDVSDSGNTTFIEPMEIVQMNNLITSLKVEENEEVRKVLKALTSLVLLQEGEIIANNKIIADFDFLIAKSEYAFEISAEIAEMSDKQIVDLKEARHPLIDKEKVVSNTYYLDEEKRIVIISGPNAGGKTVSLKTVGLMVMMHQSGLAIPCKNAKLGHFNHIFIDIGDNQSLSDNLSTFSAHVSQLSEIISAVKGKDLVLLDELGTGTDPREGEALAYAVTRYLENKHALAMISSHFDALKEYAFLSEHLENSSMIFDEERLLPTYRFRLGAPGHSYALDVATRYGISKEIIEEARIYVKNNKSNDATELIDILQKKLDAATKLSDELIREKKDIDYRLRKLENDEKMLKDRRDHLLEDVSDEKQKMLKRAREEIELVMSELSKDNIKLHEVIELKKNIDDLEEQPDDVIYDEEIKEGDYVSVPSLGMSGRVTRLKGNKAHVSGDSGMSFDVEKNKLHKIPTPKYQPKINKKNNYEANINLKVGLELNLIGLHVEEAQEELIKYLDNVRLKNLSQVRIIHGFGSGALRKMVRSYLDKQKDCTYRPGDATEGMGGATVVIFKK